MKITIDEYGRLKLTKNGITTEQRCCNSRSDYCSDMCPLFGEWKDNDIQRIENGQFKISENGFIQLPICNGRVFTCNKKDFTDERQV